MKLPNPSTLALRPTSSYLPPRVPLRADDRFPVLPAPPPLFVPPRLLVFELTQASLSVPPDGPPGFPFPLSTSGDGSCCSSLFLLSSPFGIKTPLSNQMLQT